MEPAQKAVASPDAATAVRGQVCPQELKPEEEPVHPPQSVGREFVRQYYTMLHQAPEQLHRLVVTVPICFVCLVLHAFDFGHMI